MKNEKFYNHEEGPYYWAFSWLEVSSSLLTFTFKTTLGLLGRPAAAGRFGRPGKSAAAAAITLSTQGVNEHQIESLQQTNYSWSILRCFMIYSWVNILPDS